MDIEKQIQTLKAASQKVVGAGGLQIDVTQKGFRLRMKGVNKLEKTLAKVVSSTATELLARIATARKTLAQKIDILDKAEAEIREIPEADQEPQRPTASKRSR
jgi:GTP1/Obg family GTP-binding protein